MSYDKDLATREWQEFRSRVLERDGERCTRCKLKLSRLEAHHTRYIEGRRLWEYDLSDLVTLCRRCHEEAHKEPVFIYSESGIVLRGFSHGPSPFETDRESSPMTLEGETYFWRHGYWVDRRGIAVSTTTATKLEKLRLSAR
jgi:hypothetical protein